MPTIPQRTFYGDAIESELYKAFDTIERKLLNDLESETATQFEVRVDGLKVVSRTDDPTEITNAIEFIDFSLTQEVDVSLYEGTSRYFDRHVFVFDRNRPKKRQELTLEGLNSQIQQGVEQARRQWEHDQQTLELSQLRKDHEELEAYTGKIEEELETLRKKKLHLGDVNLLEVGGVFLEGFIRRNPSLLEKIPGGAGLAGAIEQDNQDRAREKAEPEEYSASISSVEEQTDPMNLEVVKLITGNFNKQQMQEVMQLLAVLSSDPNKIGPVLKFLGQGQSDDNSNTETEQTIM